MTDELSVLSERRHASRIRHYHLNAEMSSVFSVLSARGHLRSNVKNRHRFNHLPCSRSTVTWTQALEKWQTWTSLQLLPTIGEVDGHNLLDTSAEVRRLPKPLCVSLHTVLGLMWFTPAYFNRSFSNYCRCDARPSHTLISFQRWCEPTWPKPRQILRHCIAIFMRSTFCCLHVVCAGSHLGLGAITTQGCITPTNFGAKKANSSRTLHCFLRNYETACFVTFDRPKWPCCNLSGSVVLIMWFTTNGTCVKNNTIIRVARASNSKRDCDVVALPMWTIERND